MTQEMRTLGNRGTMVEADVFNIFATILYVHRVAGSLKCLGTRLRGSHSTADMTSLGMRLSKPPIQFTTYTDQKVGM